MIRSYRLPTEQDTREFGRALATGLRPGDLVVLAGPLGAGKTVLAQGIGAGIGVVGAVTSPTFVIARVHRPDPETGRGVPMVHVDAYRLGLASDPPTDSAGSCQRSPEAAALAPREAAGPRQRPSRAAVRALREVDDLDLDAVTEDSVTVVEWGEGVVEHLADAHLLVRIDRHETEVREITLVGTGGDWERRLAGWSPAPARLTHR